MSEHRNPVPTIDIILQKGSDILLIKRKNDPFKDYLALPGGFVNEGESVEDASKAGGQGGNLIGDRAN